MKEAETIVPYSDGQSMGMDWEEIYVSVSTAMMTENGQTAEWKINVDRRSIVNAPIDFQNE